MYARTDAITVHAYPRTARTTMNIVTAQADITADAEDHITVTDK